MSIDDVKMGFRFCSRMTQSSDEVETLPTHSNIKKVTIHTVNGQANQSVMEIFGWESPLMIESDSGRCFKDRIGTVFPRMYETLRERCVKRKVTE